MRKLFRRTLLLAFTATTLASCELIPDELIDILHPQPKPGASCELVEINHPSDLPDQSFTLTIDSTGANEVTLTKKFMEMGQEVTHSSVITPKENEPNTWQADSYDEKGLTSREVTLDAQKRVSRISYSYNASTPEANLASRVTTYNYNKLNTVEATTLEIEGSDTLTYKATFEYSTTGNLMKVSTEDNVISYEYGTTDNKLYNFQKAYAGFNVFSPLSYNTSISIEAPMPSRKLPTKQIIETNMNATNHYTWTINSHGYPTKLELLDENQETRQFEYSYVNCETL